MRSRYLVVLTAGILLSGSLVSAAEIHLTLDDAVTRAVAANPGLEALASSAQAADREARAAGRQRWGGLDGVATYERFQDDQIVRPISRQLLEGGFAGLPFDREQWRYGVIAEVPLYLGGKLTNGIEIARLEAEKSQVLLEGTHWQLRFNVISLYAAAQGLDAVGDALDRQIASLEATTSRLELMVAAGKRPDVDRLKVVEELQGARAARAAVHANRVKVGALLLSVLGQDPTQDVTVDPLPDRLPRLAEDPQQLHDDLENAAPIRRARLDVEQAERAVRNATGEMIPRLFARGSYMVNDAPSLDATETTWALSLGMVTLTAVIIAVGMLLDDAIVVLENIERHYHEAGTDVHEAVVGGTQEVMLAIFSGTYATVMVLLPIIYIGGFVQTVLRPLSISLVIALIASYVVSVTVIPLLAPHLLRRRDRGGRNRFERLVYRFNERVVDPIRDFYVRLTEIALRHRALFLAVALVLLVASARQMPLVGRDLMPPMDTGIIKVNFETDANTSLEQTEGVMSRMESTIFKRPEVVSVSSVIGSVRVRTRPILMTAVGTSVGMIPIAMEWAIGLERLSPLAIVAIGGLMISTFLTMVYVPILYSLFEDLQHWAAGLARRARPQAQEG